MELAPVRPADFVASDSDVVLSTAEGSAEKPHGPDDGNCFTPQRIAFLKRNIPSIISLLSVLLNVIIISALIPNLRNDVTYMQGQAASIQSTVNSLQQTMVSLQKQISDTGSAINTFNGQIASIQASFNATETAITAFELGASENIAQMQQQSSSILASFQDRSHSIGAQLNLTLSNANTLAATLQSNITDAEGKVSAAIQSVTAATDASLATLSAQASDYNSTSMQALTQMTAVRDIFVQQTVPQVTANLQSLNQSAAIAKLQTLFTNSIASLATQIGSSVTALTARMDHESRLESIRPYLTMTQAQTSCKNGSVTLVPRNYMGQTGAAICAANTGGVSTPLTCAEVRFWFFPAGATNPEPYSSADIACTVPVVAAWPFGWQTVVTPDAYSPEWSIYFYAVCCV